ncbi:MAG: MarR family transcriptional regulator [Lachnospiraceae bacterium]|nr:MarR family transcriptional regulator [Lachnospiraceae bacterium]
MHISNEKQFRESIRILERRLGLLNKYSNTCCGDEITLAQCHALVEIGRAESSTLKELAVVLGLDTSTTSRTVEGLVKKQLVKRTTSKEDRRSINISLTTKGYQSFHAIENTMDNFFATVFSFIPIEEKMNVLHSLDLIATAFKKNVD